MQDLDPKRCERIVGYPYLRQCSRRAVIRVKEHGFCAQHAGGRAGTPIDGTEAEAAKQNAEAAKLINYIVEHYETTATDASVKDIAAGLQWPETRVRRLLAVLEPTLHLQGVQYGSEERPSYSTNYPSMQSGVHRVVVYGPTRRELARRLVAVKRIGAALLASDEPKSEEEAK